ncbi:MAG: hypothetical protein LBI05_02085 [Planctomycetaceae bacterium]|jgi:hypothetical protein|nr:hypothetical protein [Planctomycetaceae bacterium]
MKSKRSNLDAVFHTRVEPVRTIRKSRGGISDLSELTAPTVQKVRGEFLSATFNPVVTIACKAMTFNQSCINFFPGSPHVTVSLDVRQRLLVIAPAVDESGDSLQIAHCRNGKNAPRPCPTKLCPRLFYLMRWNPEAKYRIAATFQEYNDQNMTFRLDDAVQILPKAMPVEASK